jgi:hypothetical protein
MSCACRGGQVQGVGLQGVVVANQFKFDPVGFKHLTRHFGGGDGLLHAVATGGVGQHGHAHGLQQVPKCTRVVALRGLPAQGCREHGRVGAGYRFAMTVGEG